jgi:D-alanine-D-alanine ligase-like ATP-grasp enzyme
MELVDTKYVDVKIVDGKLVIEAPLKDVALQVLKPIAEKLKVALPDIGDAAVDFILKEIEEL